MKLVLLGYMGVGKSTLGRLLADKLASEFIDLDDYIETREGMTIQELFRTKGEIYFRKVESLALEELLVQDRDFVLALGGGTPVYGNNMKKITDAFEVKSIYLKLNLNELVSRLFSQRVSRPLISHYNDRDQFEEFVRKHLFERQQFYFLANHVLDISDASPKESLAKLLDVLE